MSSRLRFSARILLVPYLVALLLIVWLPGQDAEKVTGIVAWAAHVLELIGVPFEAGYTVLEFLANVALFVPFGILVRLAFPPLGWWTIPLGGALSVVIELVQLAIPGRFSTISDVVANTLGTGVGVLLLQKRMHSTEQGPQR